MKTQHPPLESYWADNIVTGLGKGAKSFAWGVARGIGGVIYDPINETVKRGVIGLPVGIAKGVGGLVGRPAKGCFDMVAQPVVGCIKTPGFVYNKLMRPEDTIKPGKQNFGLFGLQSTQFGSEKGDDDDEETCFILEPYGAETDGNQTQGFGLMDQDRDPNDLTTPEVSRDRLTQKLYGSGNTNKRSLAARYKAQDNSTKQSKSSVFNSCIDFEGDISSRDYMQPVQECLD